MHFPLKLSEITQDEVFRCRLEDDEDIIEAYTETFTQYREAEERGEKPDYPFPPVWVRKRDDETYTLITGFHRDTAARRAGLTEIQVKVFTGTEDEALWLAMRDNRTNGLRLKHGDLKYCIVKALKRLTGLTAGAVAKELGCGRSYAYRIAEEVSPRGHSTSEDDERNPDCNSTTGKLDGDGSEGTSEPVEDLPVEDTTASNTPAKEDEKQPPTLEEQIGKALANLDGLIAKRPSREERVRILEKVSEWVRKQRDNLPPPQDTTVKKKRPNSRTLEHCE
jgi:ParB-like chromosome segregation protein Spo0J